MKTEKRKPRTREPLDDKFTVDEQSRAGRPTDAAIEMLAIILIDLAKMRQAGLLDDIPLKSTNV